MRLRSRPPPLLSHRDCIAPAIYSDSWAAMDTASEFGVRGTSFRAIPQSIKIINHTVNHSKINSEATLLEVLKIINESLSPLRGIFVPENTLHARDLNSILLQLHFGSLIFRSCTSEIKL